MNEKTFELILKIYDFKPNSFIHILIFDKTNKIKRKATPTDKKVGRARRRFERASDQLFYPG